VFHTVVCDLPGIKYPILQGAMEGGGDGESLIGLARTLVIDNNHGL